MVSSSHCRASRKQERARERADLVLPSRDNVTRLVGDSAPCFAIGEATFLITEFVPSIGPSEDVAGSADIALELASWC